MDDLLKEAREAFELCVQHEAENRAEALDDIRFSRLGEQWPEQVRKRRELDGRPCLTINRLPAFIRLFLNTASALAGAKSLSQFTAAEKAVLQKTWATMTAQGNTLLAQALAGIDPTKPGVVGNG